MDRFFAFSILFHFPFSGVSLRNFLVFFPCIFFTRFRPTGSNWARNMRHQAWAAAEPDLAYPAPVNPAAVVEHALDRPRCLLLPLLANFYPHTVYDMFYYDSGDPPQENAQRRWGTCSSNGTRTIPPPHSSLTLGLFTSVYFYFDRSFPNDTVSDHPTLYYSIID